MSTRKQTLIECYEDFIDDCKEEKIYLENKKLIDLGYDYAKRNKIIESGLVIYCVVSNIDNLQQRKNLKHYSLKGLYNKLLNSEDEK